MYQKFERVLNEIDGMQLIPSLKLSYQKCGGNVEQLEFWDAKTGMHLLIAHGDSEKDYIQIEFYDDEDSSFHYFTNEYSFVIDRMFTEIMLFIYYRGTKIRFTFKARN